MNKLEWKIIDRYKNCHRDTIKRFTINRMGTCYELYDNEKSVVIGFYDSLQLAKDVANSTLSKTI